MLTISWRLVIMVLAALSLLAMVSLWIKPSRNRIRALLLNLATGLSAALLINLSLPALGIHVAYNLFTLFAAGTLGIPGVALVAALQAIL